MLSKTAVISESPCRGEPVSCCADGGAGPGRGVPTYRDIDGAGQIPLLELPITRFVISVRPSGRGVFIPRRDCTAAIHEWRAPRDGDVDVRKTDASPETSVRDIARLSSESAALTSPIRFGMIALQEVEMRCTPRCNGAMRTSANSCCLNCLARRRPRTSFVARLLYGLHRASTRALCLRTQW